MTETDHKAEVGRALVMVALEVIDWARENYVAEEHAAKVLGGSREAAYLKLKKLPAKVRNFVVMNYRSPVVSGGSFEGGGYYTLMSGQTFRMKHSDWAKLPDGFPIWHYPEQKPEKILSVEEELEIEREIADRLAVKLGAYLAMTGNTLGQAAYNAWEKRRNSQQKEKEND